MRKEGLNAMQIMYVSHRFETNICATMHLCALREYYGEDNVFVVDLRTEKPKYCGDNRIVFGPMSICEKVSRRIQGNSWYLTNARINRICDIISSKGITSVFVDESIFGLLVKRIKKRNPDVRVISFYHDIAQDLYVYWRKNKGIKFELEMRAGITGERLNQEFSDVNLVLNERDKQQFIKYFNKEPEGLLPTAVESPRLKALSAEEFDFNSLDNKRVLLFVGSLYQPNIDGLDWFVKEVYGKISETFILMVIGRGLETLREKYKNIPGMVIVGAVSDLAPYYNHADVVIAPIFDGGGMKQKTAEAFAYGKPFVGTRESLQGYEQAVDSLFDGRKVVFSCETGEEYCKAIDEIDSSDLYGYYCQLTEYFEENFSVKAIQNRLKKWII